MTDYQMYVRILRELSPLVGSISAQQARANLQDVLCELRNRAAAQRGDPTGQETQDSAEAYVVSSIYNAAGGGQ